MTTITLNRAAGSIAATANATFFSRMIAGVKAWNELRVTRKALNKLSDRELADIGLHRGDIAEIGR